MPLIFVDESSAESLNPPSGSGTLGGFRDSALDSSTKTRGNRKSEKEAYLLESKPDIVMEAFDLYCQALSLGEGKETISITLRSSQFLTETASDSDKWQLASQTRCTPGHSK